MTKSLTTRLDKKAAIKRLIFDPLIGRGNPPPGWTEDKLILDVCAALEEYPESIIEQIGDHVRLNHTKQSWPLAGDYLRAARAITVGDPQAHPSSADEVMKRSIEGHEYVRARMLAGGSELFFRASKCFATVDLRRWLFDKACACLRAGDDPYVSNDDLEAFLAPYEATSVGQAQPAAPQEEEMPL